MKRSISTLLLAAMLVGCNAKERFVETAEKVVPKTVDIHVFGTTEIKLLDVSFGTFAVHIEGSGVFVSENNHVLTCAHLFWIDTVSTITVCNSAGTCTAATGLYKEDNLDLALIQANFDTPTPYARIADPRNLKVGQEVLAVGSPLGFAFSVSHGIISALNRNDLGVYNMTQSDAFLNPGNSGGPLFNLKGEIVGINSRIVPPVPANIFTGLGFSVQSGQIVEFLTRVRQMYAGLPVFKHEYWYDGLLAAIGYHRKGE